MYKLLIFLSLTILVDTRDSITVFNYIPESNILIYTFKNDRYTLRGRYGGEQIIHTNYIVTEYLKIAIEKNHTFIHSLKLESASDYDSWCHYELRIYKSYVELISKNDNPVCNQNQTINKGKPVIKPDPTSKPPTTTPKPTTITPKPTTTVKPTTTPPTESEPGSLPKDFFKRLSGVCSRFKKII